MRSRAGSVKVVVQMLLGGIFFFGLPSAYAAEDITVKITGEIYIPPCEINRGRDINVSFGNMSLYEVDGYKNAKTEMITVRCDYYQGTPYVRVMGAQMTGGGNHVLKTSGANPSSLGIALYQGENVDTAYPLRIGAGEQGQFGYKITRGLAGENTATGQFTFTAVPYKYGTGTLNAGNFSATATMSISYL